MTPGQPAQALNTGELPLEGAYFPQYDPGGDWIYFSGRRAVQTVELWRVRADGGGPERIGQPAQWGDEDYFASPSFDGTRVLYSTTRTLNPQGASLRVLDVRTRAVTDLPIIGNTPRWSPTNEYIAYSEGGYYYVARSDGTQARKLGLIRRDNPPSWSPDGLWLAVVLDPDWQLPHPFSGVALIEVATGLVLPLGWTNQYWYPAWQH
jgi:Tol biopolymer transport system component